MDQLILELRGDTVSSAAALLREVGCVLLRGALPRKAVLAAGTAVAENAERLKKMLGREVNDLPLCFAEQQGSDPDVLGMRGGDLRNFTDPLTFSGMTADWFYEGNRNFKRWFWDHGAEFPNVIVGLVGRSLLPAVYQSLYASVPLCSYAHCVVRYQRSDLKHKSYAFHQDGSYHSRISRDHVGLTTWIPLCDCGRDAPGLELYPRALDEVLPAPEGVEAPHLFSDTQTVLERFGNQLWAPEFAAGDVLVFTHFVLHRTHIVPGMTRQRQSADFRVFPGQSVPEYVKKDAGWIFELPRTESAGTP
jgi:hypothetical protein